MSQSSRPEILQVKDVTFGVKGLTILNRVSFSILKGEKVGIIGPNGSGKTTVFNCLSGFNSPESGDIVFQGQSIIKLPPYRRAALGLGRVFQNFGIFRDMSVLENVLTAIESRQSLSSTFWPWGAVYRKNCASAREYLAQVGLERKANDRAGSLSGGQMRLLEIIRTLAFGAEVFLLDEPTAGVSPKMKDDVANLIVKLETMGKTVLVIEHDINFIQKFCERIIVLDTGKVVLDDTPENVRANKVLQEIYFGHQGSALDRTPNRTSASSDISAEPTRGPVLD